MKLTGKLKKQVEAAATMEEKKDAIENAGMLLDDEELAVVAGGEDSDEYVTIKMSVAEYFKSATMNYCPRCGEKMDNDANLRFLTVCTAKCVSCKIIWKYWNNEF